MMLMFLKDVDRVAKQGTARYFRMYRRHTATGAACNRSEIDSLNSRPDSAVMVVVAPI